MASTKTFATFMDEQTDATTLGSTDKFLIRKTDGTTEELPATLVGGEWSGVVDSSNASIVLTSVHKNKLIYFDILTADRTITIDGTWDHGDKCWIHYQPTVSEYKLSLVEAGGATVGAQNEFLLPGPAISQLWVDTGDTWGVVVKNLLLVDPSYAGIYGTPASITGGEIIWTYSGLLVAKTLDVVAFSQIDWVSGGIEAPDNQSYTFSQKIPIAGTITNTVTQSLSGTCTATFKVNTTALGGTANAVSSAEVDQAHASSNTFAAGDDLVVTISANSSCVDMAFTVVFTRILD